MGWFKEWRRRRLFRRVGLAEPTWIVRPADRGQLTLPTDVRSSGGVGGLPPVSTEMLEDAPQIQELIRARYLEAIRRRDAERDA